MSILDTGVFRRPVAKQYILAVCLGIVIGFNVALLYLGIFSRQNLVNSLAWTSVQQPTQNLHDPHHHNDLQNVDSPDWKAFGAHGSDEEFHRDEDAVAKQMAQQVRVLCWIMTSPGNHEKKARHVKATWGRRCNVLLFMSSTNDTSLPTVGLPVSEGRDHLWSKTKEAFRYVYNHHLNDADWFLKADDDTYVIVENLRYMLSSHNPNETIYFGCRFKPYVKQGYMSGGAGYVLSKTAVERFVEDALPNKDKCRQDHGGSEDVEIGKCLENVGVIAGDSRDPYGRWRFFPFVPEHHLIPGHALKIDWFVKYIFYETKEGLDCCSDTAISFHYVSPNLMYVMEYLIYHLRPYGISQHHHMEVPENVTSTETEQQTIERTEVTTIKKR